MANYAVTVRPTLVLHVNDAADVAAAKERVEAHLHYMEVQQPMLGVVLGDDWFAGVLLLDENGNPADVPNDEDMVLHQKEVDEFTQRVQEDDSPTWKWVLEAAQTRLNEARKMRVLAGIE